MIIQIRKFLVLIAYVFIIFTLISNISFSKEKQTKEQVGRNTAYALDLYHELKNKNDNIFVSPFSLSLVYAMAYAGA